MWYHYLEEKGTNKRSGVGDDMGLGSRELVGNESGIKEASRKSVSRGWKQSTGLSADERQRLSY